ncbi:hypothetical protein MTO96_006380 [Rhipicephalus appendiculatus]
MSCSGLAPPPPFLLSPGRPVVPWEQWHRMFETYLLTSGAAELSPERRRAILIHCLGTEGRRIFNTLPATAATTATASAEKFDAATVPTASADKPDANWDANCTECLRRGRHGAEATLRVNQQRHRGSADRTVTRQPETSSSATNVSSSRTSSTKPCPHGETSDSESEDSGKTSKPSDLTPGPSANGNGKPSKKPDDSSTKEKLKMAAIVAGVAALVGAAAVVAAPVALAGIGFTSSGVAAGSMAAAYQATLGGFIAKGSVFAVLQSFGAAGIPAAVQGGIAAAGATVGGGITALFRGSGKGPDAGGGNSSGRGPDEGGDSGGILTGAEADARKGAKGDERCQGNRRGKQTEK